MRFAVYDPDARRRHAVVSELARHDHEVNVLRDEAALDGAIHALSAAGDGAALGGLILAVPTDGVRELDAYAARIRAWRAALGDAGLVIAVVDAAPAGLPERLLSDGVTDVWLLPSYEVGQEEAGAARVGAQLPLRLPVACAYAALAARHGRLERDLALAGRTLDSARVAFCLTDPALPDNPVVYVNDAFLALTGYDRDEVLGRNCRFLQDEASDPGTVARLRAAVAEGGAITVDILNRRRDGSRFWNQLSVDPVRDAAGRVVRYVGVSVDVTARIADLDAATAPVLIDDGHQHRRRRR